MTTQPKPTETLKPGSIVRVLTRIGSKTWRALYGHVLSVSHREGQPKPALAIAVADPSAVPVAGRNDWTDTFQRHIGVEHVDHPSVEAGHTSICYVDGIPPAAEDLDPADYFPEPEKPAAPSAMDLDAAAANHPASVSARPDGTFDVTKEGLVVGNYPTEEEARRAASGSPTPAPSLESTEPKSAVIDGVPGNHPLNAQVSVFGQMVEIRHLTSGMQLDDIKAQVAGVAVDGDTLRIATKPLEPSAPVTEHKTYADGTTATGPGPLPDKSPAEQAAEQQAAADKDAAQSNGAAPEPQKA
jgi:hypothetical protein